MQISLSIETLPFMQHSRSMALSYMVLQNVHVMGPYKKTSREMNMNTPDHSFSELCGQSMYASEQRYDSSKTKRNLRAVHCSVSQAIMSILLL